MNRLLTEAAPLDNRLLSTDEEEYDRVALHVVNLFEKSPDLIHADLDIEASISSGKSVGRQLPASVLPEGLLWPNITRLLLHFDPIQVRYVGKLFSRVVEVVARGGEQAQNTVPGIQLLANAIIRLDPTSSTLTTTHYHYIRLCLIGRAYGEAISILNRPICSIPSLDTSKQVGNRAYKFLCSVHQSSLVYLTPATGLTQRITSRIYLEYFLLGGMCYMAVGEYQKALDFFEIVLAAPTVQTVASAVMVETYKKWLLVNLILKGTDAALPKSMSPGAIKVIRPLAKPYESIVDAFKSHKLERLQAEMQEGVEIWQQDDNYGLVHEVFLAFRKFSVLRLSKIYAALTIEEIAPRLSRDAPDVQGTLTYLRSLIATGQLQAEIVPSTSGGAGSLRFGASTQTTRSEAEVETQLRARSQELQMLMQQVNDYGHQMSISRDYVDHLHKLKAARDKEKKGLGAATRPIGLDLQDEDMMDDL